MSEQTRKYIAFTLTVLGCAFGNLSQTATNNMLLSIQEQFQVSVATVQLVTTVYMLTVGVTIPLVSFLSKRFSVRTLLLIAWSFLFSGALISMLAPSFPVLLVGRFVQALSAGIGAPLVMTLAVIYFPKGKQATAMGLAGIALGFAPNIGPTVGGLFESTWDWHAFFTMLAGAAFVLIVLTAAILKKEDASDKMVSLDMMSVVLSTLGFGLLLWGFSNASSTGVASPLFWGPTVLGVFVVVLFLRRQRQVDNPLIHLDIFKSKKFSYSFLASVLLYMSFMGITLVIPLLMQNVHGGTPADAGFIFFPPAIIAIFSNPLGGILGDKYGVRKVTLFSSAMLVIGAVSMVVYQGSSVAVLATLQSIRGIGIGMLIGPLTSYSYEELPREIVTDGSSFTASMRQIGSSFSTAIMVFLITLGGTLFPEIPIMGYSMALSFSALCAIGCMTLIIAKIR